MADDYILEFRKPMQHKEQYQELLGQNMFEETYQLLERNTSAIQDTIEQKKHIKEFFNLVWDNFESILDKNKQSSFTKTTVESLTNMPIFSDVSKKLDLFMDDLHLSLMFSISVLGNQFDNAKYLLSFINNKNINYFPNTVDEVVSQENVQALNFLCENLKNIHYDNDELLRVCASMPSETLVSLIDNYEFDINSTNKDTGLNLMQILVSNKNTRSYKLLTKKYADSINWSQIVKLDNNQSATLFDFIDETQMYVEFYGPLLDNKGLNLPQIERIAQSLFQTDQTVMTYSHTDLYNKLFDHPSFNPKTINLQQGHALFALMGRVGVAAQIENSENLARAYYEIVQSYVATRHEEDLPHGVSYHVVGAAVYITRQSKDNPQVLLDLCSLIFKNYPKYINEPNPNGMLPITQVEKDSPVYKLLLNNGAINPEPPPSFWNSVLSWGKKKKVEVQPARENTTPAKETQDNSFEFLRSKMRDDFRQMRETLADPLCDPIVKMRCENMFLKSDNLVMKMGKHNIQNAYEDVHFLSQNFSKYLKQSLESYIKVCQATVDFAQEDKRDEKLNSAKNQCLEQVGLLETQLNLITQNTFSSAEASSLNDMRVQTKFLEERLQTNASSETEVNDEVINIVPQSAAKKLKM